MNIQSILILALVLVAFVLTLRYVFRKNKRNKGCGCCDHCVGCDTPMVRKPKH